MKTSRALGALVAIALAMICTIGGTNLFALKNLRESTLRLEKNAARLTGSDYRELLDRIDAAYAERRAQDVREARH